MKMVFCACNKSLWEVLWRRMTLWATGAFFPPLHPEWDIVLKLSPNDRLAYYQGLPFKTSVCWQANSQGNRFSWQTRQPAQALELFPADCYLWRASEFGILWQEGLPVKPWERVGYIIEVSCKRVHWRGEVNRKEIKGQGSLLKAGDCFPHP